MNESSHMLRAVMYIISASNSNNSPGSCIAVIQRGELDIAVSNRLNLGLIKVLSPDLICRHWNLNETVEYL